MNRVPLFCIVLLLCASCDGCNKRKEGKAWSPHAPLVTVAQETERKLTRREAAQQLARVSVLAIDALTHPSCCWTLSDESASRYATNQGLFCPTAPPRIS